MVQVQRQNKCAASRRRRIVEMTCAVAAWFAVVLIAAPVIANPTMAPAPIDQPPPAQIAQSPHDTRVASADAAAAGRYLAPSAPARAGSADTLAPGLNVVAFGVVVAKLDSFRLVPNWQRVLQRATADDALCRKSCGSKAWRQLIGDLRQLPHEAQIAAVQQRLNRVPYRDDLANWHVVDYWATPDEFLRKGGDCEDYAIAKYFALRAAGWQAADLRVMLSHRRGDAVGHAYLILRDRGDWLVLDNQQLAPYRPTTAIDGLWAGYSLNERDLWIHRNVAAPDFLASSMQ